MKIKALRSIRFNGVRWLPGQVLDLPDLEAKSLVANEYAVEVSSKEPAASGEKVTRNVNKLIKTNSGS